MQVVLWYFMQGASVFFLFGRSYSSLSKIRVIRAVLQWFISSRKGDKKFYLSSSSAMLLHQPSLLKFFFFLTISEIYSSVSVFVLLKRLSIQYFSLDLTTSAKNIF